MFCVFVCECVCQCVCVFYLYSYPIWHIYFLLWHSIDTALEMRNLSFSKINQPPPVNWQIGSPGIITHCTMLLL